MHVFEALSGTALFIFWALLALLTVLLPFSAYGAYSWSRKSCLELRRTNHKLDLLLDALDDESDPG